LGGGADLLDLIFDIKYCEYVGSFYNEDHHLVNLYKHLEGDDEIKSAVICGVLEHLFEDPEIVKDFSDWERKPKLKEAYNQAIEWGKDYWERKIEKKRKKKKISILLSVFIIIYFFRYFAGAVRRGKDRLNFRPLLHLDGLITPPEGSTNASTNLV
jgi:hypothetical protein